MLSIVSSIEFLNKTLWALFGGSHTINIDSVISQNLQATFGTTKITCAKVSWDIMVHASVKG
jgi:hypothetical protein